MNTAPLADRLLLNPADAAALLSISKSEAHRLIAKGELRSVRIGSRLKVPRSAIEQYVADLERAARIEEDRLRLLLSRPKRRSS